MRALEYRLTLHVDYPGQRFEGDLEFTVADPTSPLELDSVDLAVREAWVDGHPVSVRTDPARSKVIVPVSSTGEATIRLAYSGTVRKESLVGFYVSRFGERPLLTTMMEPVGARRLLPCLDVPDQRAVFQLTVLTDPDLVVIANGEVRTSEVVGAERRWTFEPTPRMASYLLYLGIGPIEERELHEHGVRIVAATAPGRSGRARFILELAGPVLRAYEEYYRIPYPLPKMHLIGVPDFPTGAMENWGAIAFSEIGLLVDESTTPGIRRWAVETLVHEIAHQWFGNLVTMATFSDLWLNESFATFVAAKMQDRLHLRDDPWAEFFIRTRPGWAGDSLTSTHPIKLEITDASEAGEGFDDITYYKGANVVRMLEAFLGEEPFRVGVTQYLKKFQYRNATGADLWRSLEEASGRPVGRVMESWIGRAGLPVVRVRVEEGKLHLEQTRFLYLDPATTEPPWPIPLVTEVDGERATTLFDTPSLDLPCRDPDSIRINPGRGGFFRVWYDRPLRARLLRDLATTPPTDRWAFLNDAEAFLLAGEYSLAEYLQVAAAAESSPDYASALELMDGLGLLRSVLEHDAAVEEAHRRFFLKQMARVGLEKKPGEADTEPQLREAIAAGLVRSDEGFAREMADRFPAIDQSDPALRPAIAAAFARMGGAGALDRLFDRLVSDADEDGAAGAAFAMGYLPTEGALESALGRCLDPRVRGVHVRYLVRAVAGHPRGRAAVWRWMTAHLREFEKRSEGSDMLSRLLHSTIPFAGLGRSSEVHAFFQAESFPEASAGIRKGLELLDILERVQERATGQGSGGPPTFEGGRLTSARSPAER